MASQAPIGTEIARTSLADHVYSRLVDALLSGSLRGGAALHVADIARELKVSPSPVRDAISRLAAEGLATSNPNRRTTVVSFSERDMVETFQLREILECGATRLAAARITPAEVEQLKKVVDECERFTGVPSQKRQRLELDNQFHLLIAEASGNALLRQEILRCSRRVRVMQWLKLDPATLTQAHPEHMRVIRALEKRDADAAEAAMHEHLRVALELVLKGLP